jgi:hypothetical protein
MTVHKGEPVSAPIGQADGGYEILPYPPPDGGGFHILPYPLPADPGDVIGDLDARIGKLWPGALPGHDKPTVHLNGVDAETRTCKRCDSAGF